MSSYFSSDYHLGHKNVIKYDNRPFKSIEEMNDEIIARHNEVVDVDDDFYFLDDFSFDRRRTEEWLQRLNGNKYFIRGNHDGDDTIKLYQKYGTYLGELAEVTVGGQRIVLCHYAMLVWNKSHRGVWHLYGHSHQSLPEDPHSLSFDCGIMRKGYEYTPLSFMQVGREMSGKKFKPLDHHG